MGNGSQTSGEPIPVEDVRFSEPGSCSRCAKRFNPKDAQCIRAGGCEDESDCNPRGGTLGLARSIADAYRPAWRKFSLCTIPENDEFPPRWEQEVGPAISIKSNKSAPWASCDEGPGTVQGLLWESWSAMQCAGRQDRFANRQSVQGKGLLWESWNAMQCAGRQDRFANRLAPKVRKIREQPGEDVMRPLLAMRNAASAASNLPGGAPLDSMREQADEDAIIPRLAMRNDAIVASNPPVGAALWRPDGDYLSSRSGFEPAVAATNSEPWASYEKTEGTWLDLCMTGFDAMRCTRRRAPADHRHRFVNRLEREDSDFIRHWKKMDSMVMMPAMRHKAREPSEDSPPPQLSTANDTSPLVQAACDEASVVKNVYEGSKLDAGAVVVQGQEEAEHSADKLWRIVEARGRRNALLF